MDEQGGEAKRKLCVIEIAVFTQTFESLLRRRFWLRRGLRADALLALRPSAAWRRAACPRVEIRVRGLSQDRAAAWPLLSQLFRVAFSSLFSSVTSVVIKSYLTTEDTEEDTDYNGRNGWRADYRQARGDDFARRGRERAQDYR